MNSSELIDRQIAQGKNLYMKKFVKNADEKKISLLVDISPRYSAIDSN